MASTNKGVAEKIVMAKALGLSGCDYAEPPFTVNNTTVNAMYEPTKAILFNQVARDERKF